MKSVGLVEGGRIPVGGRVGDQDRIARSHRNPADLDVGSGDPDLESAVAFREEPEQLLHRHRKQLGVVAQPG